MTMNPTPAAQPVNPCMHGEGFCGQHGYDCPPEPAVSSAAAQSAPAETALALRDGIAETMARADGWDWAAANFASLSTPATDRYRRCADAVLAVLPAADRAAEEAYRLALSTALGLGTGANWEAIRDRAEDLTAEVQQLTEGSRRLLEQRQEMAAERFAWQERGDRAEARVRQMEAAAPADRAAVLNKAAAYANEQKQRAESAEAAIARVRKATANSFMAGPNAVDVARVTDVLAALDEPKEAGR